MKKLARLTALLLTGALLLALTACGAAPLAPEQQAKQQIQERDNEIARLKAEIEQLKQTPAAQPAEAHVQQEPGAGAEDITTYAEEHGTLETMAKAKELGFFNLK